MAADIERFQCRQERNAGGLIARGKEERWARRETTRSTFARDRRTNKGRTDSARREAVELTDYLLACLPAVLAETTAVALRTNAVDHPT